MAALRVPVAEWTARTLCTRLRSMLRAGELDLPAPAAGRTAQRHRALYELGRLDLSIARLAEAHTDALAIIHEAGRKPIKGALYGVWASDGPSSLLTATADRRGGWRLDGRKLYCSGAGLVDVALVTVHDKRGLWLVELLLKREGVSIDAGGWETSAFAATNTCPVRFRQVRAGESTLVGGADWYTRRPGFWHGAIGPAACWAGGAAGLADAAREIHRRDAHTLAHLGALQALTWQTLAALDQSGEQIDRGDSNYTQARHRALIVRHLIERSCTEVLDRFGRATGPQLLAFAASVARRHAELSLYIRQCHAERDLEAIAADE